uniref:Uncharacterized protein n=1 Tax=viral metagenome TaxID=1070528 RepID=A0A6M3J591_9ZZZZ
MHKLVTQNGFVKKYFSVDHGTINIDDPKRCTPGCIDVSTGFRHTRVVRAYPNTLDVGKVYKDWSIRFYGLVIVLGNIFLCGVKI